MTKQFTEGQLSCRFCKHRLDHKYIKKPCQCGNYEHGKFSGTEKDDISGATTLSSEMSGTEATRSSEILEKKEVE